MSRTTYQQHAIITKRVINLDHGEGRPISCAWPECERQATSLYELVQCEHSPMISCSAVDQGVGGGRHYRYAFCRERCRAYFAAAMGRLAHDTAARNRGRISGNLPPGYRHAL